MDKELEKFLYKIARRERNTHVWKGITVRSGRIYSLNGKYFEVCAECPLPEACKDGRCSQV